MTLLAEVVVYNYLLLHEVPRKFCYLFDGGVFSSLVVALSNS